ncbi:MAG: serine/threonine protein kinase [Thermoleophilaceae bacterium]|nr:serine/threonine protein kinase [Thermoleophilaceae bacterium]
MSTPSQVANRYTLEGRLGAGGMSTVFLAKDLVLERQVAVKLLAEHLADDEAFVARFRREALSAARLQHPNVVQVYDSGRDSDSGRHYIVMEFVDGPSCAEILRDRGTMEIEESARVIEDACNGLDYAHRAGVVHRDVKPGNLLIVGESGATKLADFGIAKAAEQTRITQVGSVLGTAAYLSPEQARGEEAGPASDLYSLGVCAYQFLTGRLPHEYSSLTELALKQQQDAILPITEFRPEVPPALDRAVRTSLEIDPDLRYGSALLMGQAIAAGLHGQYTDETMRMATSELQATRALPQDEGTRVMAEQPVQPSGAARLQVSPTAADQKLARRRQRKRVIGRIMVGLAILAAAAIVGVAVLEAERGTVAEIVENNFPGQADAIKQFLRENTQ